MAQAERDRDRLVAAAAAYLDHREKYGRLPATDAPNPTFNEFMVALIRVCPDGWGDTGKLARLILAVAGPGHVVDVPVSASEPNPPKAGR